MQRWEYMTILLGTGGVFGGKLDAAELTQKLNELGTEGWELVSAFDTNMLQGRSRDVVAIFKRPR